MGLRRRGPGRKRWRGVADAAGAPFRIRTVDPGNDVVIARLRIVREPGVDDHEVELIDDGDGGIRP